MVINRIHTFFAPSPCLGFGWAMQGGSPAAGGKRGPAEGEDIVPSLSNYIKDMQMFKLSQFHSITEEKRQGSASLCSHWLTSHERQLNRKSFCFTWGRIVWRDLPFKMKPSYAEEHLWEGTWEQESPPALSRWKKTLQRSNSTETETLLSMGCFVILEEGKFKIHTRSIIFRRNIFFRWTGSFLKRDTIFQNKSISYSYLSSTMPLDSHSQFFSPFLDHPWNFNITQITNSCTAAPWHIYSTNRRESSFGRREKVVTFQMGSRSHLLSIVKVSSL